jgi:hypothetical protein
MLRNPYFRGYVEQHHINAAQHWLLVVMPSSDTVVTQQSIPQLCTGVPLLGFEVVLLVVIMNTTSTDASKRTVKQATCIDIFQKYNSDSIISLDVVGPPAAFDLTATITTHAYLSLITLQPTLSRATNAATMQTASSALQ